MILAKHNIFLCSRSRGARLESESKRLVSAEGSLLESVALDQYLVVTAHLSFLYPAPQMTKGPHLPRPRGAELSISEHSGELGERKAEWRKGQVPTRLHPQQGTLRGTLRAPLFRRCLPLSPARSQCAGAESGTEGSSFSSTHLILPPSTEHLPYASLSRVHLCFPGLCHLRVTPL